VLLTQNFSGDQIENEMGWECIMYVGEVQTGFWRGNLRARDHLEDLDLEDKIKMGFQKVG
jgi:hypothetical protein